MINKILLTVTILLFSLLLNAQTRSQRAATFDRMNSAIRRNYVSDEDEMRWSGVAATVAGLSIIALHQFEGNEAWKYSKQGSSGWFYKPYFKQGTRPFMIPIGLTLTIGGIGTILRN